MPTDKSTLTNMNVKKNCSLSTSYNGEMTQRKRQKQACAAEIAVLYAALTCKQNKRYAHVRKVDENTDGADGQTDGQTECDAICGPLLGRRAA